MYKKRKEAGESILKLNRKSRMEILNSMEEMKAEKLERIAKLLEKNKIEEKECMKKEGLWKKENRNIFEFIGFRIKVKKSSSTFEGVEGIVLWETKNTFKILTVHKRKKTGIMDIPKKGNVFELSLKGERFEIIGDEILYSPIERAKRMRLWRI